MPINHETGREEPDPTPLARALRFQKPPTLEEIVQRTIRGALSRHAAELGHETFDEANDFDVDDDGSEFKSRHEFTEQDEEDLRIFKEAQRVKRENQKQRGAAEPAPAPAIGVAGGGGTPPAAPPANGTSQTPPP